MAFLDRNLAYRCYSSPSACMTTLDQSFYELEQSLWHPVMSAVSLFRSSRSELLEIPCVSCVVRDYLMSIVTAVCDMGKRRSRLPNTHYSIAKLLFPSLIVYSTDDFKTIKYKADPTGAVPRPVPPYNGFGSEEDSLCSCMGLIPKPPQRDFIKFMEKDRYAGRFC